MKTLALLLAVATGIFAQEFRATLSGSVVDSSGAFVPRAQVAVTNVETGVAIKAETLDNGQFTVPFLLPGTYTASAEAPGFKKTLRENIVLGAGQSFAIELRLQPGDVTEQITVSAEAPLLETEKADRGTVLDNAKVTELPPVSRDPLFTAVLVAGVAFGGTSTRPFDNNGGNDAWQVNGGFKGQSSFSLDGAPNMGLAGNNSIALIPEPEAVQEIRIQTNSYDAQYGNVGSGIFSLTLKSGTKDLHGSAYFYDKSGRWAANNFQNNKNGVRKGGSTYQQPGFELDGPVYLPKIYNGRNKTFFMAAYEHYYDDVAGTSYFSVPEPEMLNGDFSKLVTSTNQKISIYDPATGALVNGNWVRQAFPNNQIPQSRIDTVAKNILSHYPKPNYHNTTTSYSQSNLFVAAGVDDPTNHFFNFASKVDQNFGDRDRIFVRYAGNNRQEHKQTGMVNGPGEAETQTSRVNKAVVMDWIHTFSATLVFNTNFSANRFIQTSRGDANDGYSLTNLGFSQTVASQVFNPNNFGSYQFSNYQRLGWDNRLSISSEYAMRPNLTWFHGKHNVHAGLDMHLTQLATENSSIAFGLYFDRQYTQQNYLQGDALSGDAIADALLGAPSNNSNSSATFPAQTYVTYKYAAPYIQDDWKVGRRLTLNLGFRWDFALPPTERFNRLNGGFADSAVNSADKLINRTAYPYTPTLYGGLQFVGVNGVSNTPTDLYKKALQPRIGIAYQIKPWLIFRGGYGRFFMNPSNGQIQTSGFAFTNSINTTNDNGQTPIAGTMENPFPAGTHGAYGSSLGDQTFLGSSFSYANRGYMLGHMDQFSAGFQVQLPMHSVLDASYVGTRGSNVESSVNINQLPLSVRKACDYYEGGNPTYCNTSVANPFKGLAPFYGSTFYTASTVTNNQLSLPYAGFSGVTQNARNDIKSWYNSAQLTYQTRHRRLPNLIATLTLSKLITQSGFNDYRNGIMQRGLDGNDSPRRFTLGGVYGLPFGKGDLLLNTSNRLVSRIVGGWQLSWIFQWQSGTPVAMPGNVLLLQDPRISSSNGAMLPGAVANNFGAVKGQIFSPCAEVWNTNGTITPEPAAVQAGCTSYSFLVLPSYAPAVGPTYFPNLRNYSYPNTDASLSKITNITERFKVQIRADAYNATNSVGRATPDTGVTSTTFGLVQLTNSRNDRYRTIQLSIKALF